MNRAGRILTLFGLLLLTVEAPAQSLKDKIGQADALHAGYDFDGAIRIYGEVLRATGDSSLKAAVSERIILSENGRNMLQYATKPELVSSRTVPKADFFLYYGHIAEGSWVKTPNAFVSGSGHEYGKAMLFSPVRGSVVFAAPDGDGLMTLMSSAKAENGLWSEPEAISSCRSAGDEVLPVVSASGKELYFSSNALAGMGGYDLFVSRWDERRKCWGEPENLGFPYSSTGDDFLFSNTPDGEFTVFASNRSCGRDSMTIYVLRFVNSPIKSAVTSPAEALATASFSRSAAKVSKAGTDSPAQPLSAIEKKYESCHERLQDTRDRINGLLQKRSEASSDKEKAAMELSLLELQMQMGRFSDSLCALELSMLASGKSIDHSSRTEVAETPVAASGEYRFTRHGLGKLSGVEIDIPVQEDLSWGLAKAQTSDIYQDIPDGLVYMIQIAVVSRKLTSKDIKNFTPAFYVKQPSGKYLYAVGLFRTHKDASASLGKVKAAGFSDACIIAWQNGRSIAVSKAKTLE